uniref:mothers against decapentaplegic homolog 7 n=1 Tax=Myxine glutinosa TaxID=7769 RepID=UPI00358EDC01
MFRSKRAGLVRRLWRSRAMGCEEASGAFHERSRGRNESRVGQPEQAPAGRSRLCGGWRGQPEGELKAITYSVLKKMTEKQLEALAGAVESRGAAESPCVALHEAPLRLGSQPASTLVFLCRLLRWPDLRHHLELKRLRCCQSFGAVAAGNLRCCNPYHVSRLCVPESPPPPYTRFPEELPKVKEMPESSASSTETGGTSICWLPGLRGTFLPLDVRKQQPWCTLAYWEYKTRAGPLHHAHEPTVSIFYELPQCGCGSRTGDLCLKLVPATGRDSLASRRARVGAGLLLSRETDGVWAYNKGEQPAFVNSPTLDAPGRAGRTPVARRLPAGHSLKLFDPERAQRLLRTFVPAEGESVRDLFSVRVSFGKGWGRDYTRQCVLECPCWLEIFFYR